MSDINKFCSLQEFYPKSYLSTENIESNKQIAKKILRTRKKLHATNFFFTFYLQLEYNLVESSELKFFTSTC